MARLRTLMVALTCSLLATVPATSAERKGWMRYDSLVCNSRANAKKYFALYVKERDAARRFEATHLASNECHMIGHGTEIVIQRIPWSGRSICIRTKGNKDCYWVFRGWVNRG